METSTIDQPKAETADQIASDKPNWVLQVFFDGDCPLCLREINMIRKLDRKNRVSFVDIAAKEFQPDDYKITLDQLMAEIHARLPDGSWITGVEVFRVLYGAVGFRWLVPVTRLPGINGVLNWGYRVFAKNRLKWTGRCNPDGTCKID